MAERINDPALESILRPYFPVVADVFRSAERLVKRACPILGPARPGERAVDFHRAIRTKFDEFCDLDENHGIFEVFGEPDGRGLDLVRFCVTPDLHLSIRWGREKDGKISRRDSERQRIACATGMLFDGMDVEEDGQPFVTFGYSIEDDFTVASVPYWYMSRVLLLRERYDSADSIAVVARFNAPTMKRRAMPPPSVVVKARDTDSTRWSKMLLAIKSSKIA